MLDFRKVFVALSVAGLGLVGTASAQTVPTCTVSTIAPIYLSTEGTTEQLPTVTITCSNAGTATVVSPTFQISANAAFSNEFLSGTSGNVDVVVTDSSNDQAITKNLTISQSGQVTTISFNTLTVPAGGETITIANLRVNASAAPLSSAVTLTITASGVIVASGGSNQSAGYTSKSLGTPVITESPAISTCGYVMPATVSAASQVASLLVPVGFPDALKSTADETANGGNSGKAGGIAVTFSNLTANVSYYVPISVTGTNGEVLTSTATAVSSGTFATNYVLVTSASPTVTYYVTTGDATHAESFTIPVYASISSVSAIVTYNTTPPGASIVLVGQTAPTYPQYTGGVTYTASVVSTSTNTGEISPCGTTLLFPYVTSAVGFSTGIEIANAGTSSGTCTVNFYATSATGTAVTPVPSFTTAAIPAATVTTLVSDTYIAGLSGYAIATCNFLGAHGDAFIGQFGAGGSLSGNYLAIVTNTSGGATSPTF